MFIIILGVVLIPFVVLLWIVGLSNRIRALEDKVKNLSLGTYTDPVKPMNAHAYQELSNHKPIFSAAAATPASVQTPTTSELRPNISEPLIPKSSEESMLASGLLTKVGVLAVILGIGFFIKYAIDQNWISEWMRVILGIVSGALLCVLGTLWQEKYARYAAALTGGGIALLYFSVFSAYQFYHLVPQAVALVCMVIISGLGVWLAYSRKSVGLAALAIIGAYLSPVVLYNGTDQHGGLFLYVGLISIAAVSMAYNYYSSELLFLAFLGSVIDFCMWGINYLNISNTLAAAGFATFIFLVFILGGAVALYKHQKANKLPERADYYFGVLTVMLGVFYITTLYSTLNHSFHHYLPLMGLLGSIGAFFAYAVVDRLELKKVNYPLALVGTALLAFACIWQFDGKVMDFMLIACGLVLVAGGVLLKRAELRTWGLLTLIALVFAVLTTPYDTANYAFILNSKFGLVLAETAALWVAGWLYSSIEPTPEETQLSEAAHVVGSLLLWFGFSWEIVQYFQGAASVNTRNLLLSLWWIGYGTVLLIVGGAVKSTIYKKIALVIYVLAVLKVFLYDALNLETGYRIVSFIVLGVILLTVSFTYQKNKERITEFLGDGETKK